MKIAILSDTRLPTSRTFAGHGLGQVVLTIAEGLQARDHEVHLWGAPGSQFDGAVHSWEDEGAWNGNVSEFDVILDSTHYHELQHKHGNAKIVNLSQDRESNPGRCAVYSSHPHYEWHTAHGALRSGRVIANGIDVKDIARPTHSDYYLYMATFFPPKGAVGAYNAARQAGVRLVMAGPTAPGITPPHGAEYIGAFSGIDKFELLAGAKALIFPSAIECSPVTVLEALSVGTPVICSEYGGASANMRHGVTGYACRDTLDMVEAIMKIEELTPEAYRNLREKCIAHVRTHHTVEAMVDGYERVLAKCATGEVW